LGWRSASSAVDAAARRRDSSSLRLVLTRAMRQSTTARIETVSDSSATFWWMALRAKRVSASLTPVMRTSVRSARENPSTRCANQRSICRRCRRMPALCARLFPRDDFFAVISKTPLPHGRYENAPARLRVRFPSSAAAGLYRNSAYPTTSSGRDRKLRRNRLRIPW
jgi:hypothetical protein